MVLEEFDECKESTFDPFEVENVIPGFPKIGITCFSYKLINRYVERFKGEQIAEFHNGNGKVPIYKIKYKGQEIALFMSLVGAPACIVAYEELFAMGLEKIIVFGMCGVLDRNIDDLAIIVPNSAVRDEGTSYHYAPASEEVRLNMNVIKKIESKLKELNLHYHKGKTWTTDAIYRETPAKVQRRKEQGAITVDMECSAMAVVAKFRKIDFGQIFYAADSLATENYDPRSLNDHDVSKKGKVIPIALECVLTLK